MAEEYTHLFSLQMSAIKEIYTRPVLDIYSSE